MTRRDTAERGQTAVLIVGALFGLLIAGGRRPWSRCPRRSIRLVDANFVTTAVVGVSSKQIFTRYSQRADREGSRSPQTASGSIPRSARREGDVDAIVLAAGSGTRLGTGRPKCLSMIGGRPLIDHQLDALSAAGVPSPVVVVGYERAQVCAALRGRAQIVVNERYADTNSMYSFLLARERVRGATFVLNGDVLFDPHVAMKLARRRGSALACDSSSGHDPEHMKVEIRRGMLRSMSKTLDAGSCGGENLGVLRLDAPAAREAFAAADSLIASGGERAWLSSAINVVAKRRRIECVDVAGTPWVEIDFPADLEHARAAVWPAIAAPAAGIVRAGMALGCAGVATRRELAEEDLAA